MKIVLLNPININPRLYPGIKTDLESMGHSFFYFETKCKDREEIKNRIKDADILITDNTRLDAELLSCAPNLKYIDVAFTGFDHIDIDYCKKHDIKVSNASGYSTEAVAELELTLILNALRKINILDELTRNHQDKGELIGEELLGKNVGIIGTGKIGRRLIELLKPFNCNIYALNRKSAQDLAENGVLLGTIEEIFRYCKVIVLNAPLNSETKDLINRALFDESTLKPIIINTARGPIINKKDLLYELETENISYACLDVFDTEPPLQEDDLFKYKNTILTPHIGYFTKEAMLKRASIVFTNLYSFLDGKLINSVY